MPTASALTIAAIYSAMLVVLIATSAMNAVAMLAVLDIVRIFRPGAVASSSPLIRLQIAPVIVRVQLSTWRSAD